MSENRITTRISSKTFWTAAGIFAFAFCLIYLLGKTFTLLLLSLAGILIALYFHGCARLLRRKLPMGKKWSLIIAVLVNLILISGFFWFVGYRLASQIETLQEHIPSSLDVAREKLQQTSIGGKLVDYLETSGDSSKMMQVAEGFFTSGFGILSDIYIILLLGIFFTVSPSNYARGIVALVPSSGKSKARALLEELKQKLTSWIKGMLFGFLFIAVFSGLALWGLGMPLVLTLALIAGILNFIPNFGPIIALIPAILLALTISPTTAWLVVGLYTLIQIIQSAVTQPLIQQKMISIPPALIILAQVAMGILTGFWGVLLATPVLAIAITLTKRLYIDRQEQTTPHKPQQQQDD